MPSPKPSTLISFASAAALISAAASCGDSGATASTGGAGPSDGGGGSTGAIFGGGGSTANLVSGPGSGGFGGAPPPFVCDPPAEPSSLYENDAISYDITQPNPVSMCQYREDVLLLFNAAAI